MSPLTDGNEVVQGFPLSQQQRRLWGPRPSPRIACARCVVHLAGDLDRPALRRALEAVVGRHEILRTAFRSLPGMNLQVIQEATAIAIGEVDPHSLGSAGPEAFAEDLLAACQPTFDLAAGDVLRASLASPAPGEHLLLLELPALCADADTLRNLTTEIGRAYAAERGGPGI
ncbi:MAG TPA: condensation domain-containing protein, partial [Thermoanaerobaculia bacterium]|nr:condensation domain-containing protein [Thermoanaerobaculia bacterium]